MLSWVSATLVGIAMGIARIVNLGRGNTHIDSCAKVPNQ